MTESNSKVEQDPDHELFIEALPTTKVEPLDRDAPRRHPKYGERPEDGPGPGLAEELGINGYEQGPRPGTAAWKRNIDIATELRKAGAMLAGEEQQHARMICLFKFAAGIAGWPGLKRIEISFDPSDYGNPGTRLRTVAGRVLWALEPGASFAEPSSIRLNGERWREARPELAAHAEWAEGLNDCRAVILVSLGYISRHLGEVASSPT